MDPDNRTPEQKKKDEVIAAAGVRRRLAHAKHQSECEGCCPCCGGHCPEEDGTSCGAVRRDRT